MFCRMCGEQIPEDSDFCPVCGENQGITVTTEETEKSGNGVGKIAGTVAKVAVNTVKAVGSMAVSVVGPVVLSTVMDEFGGGMQKTIKRGVSNGLKKAGLKKKTPFDIGGEAFRKAKKGMQKKARK